jgi:hypothetical protein
MIFLGEDSQYTKLQVDGEQNLLPITNHVEVSKVER